MRVLIRTLSVVIWIIGCSRDAPENGAADATSSDGPVDAGRDVSPDLRGDGDMPPPDSGIDAATDAGPDLASDQGQDLGVDSGPDDAGTGDGSCTMAADDPSAIGDNCENPPGYPDPTLCPDGYECIEFHGFVGTFTCEIQCTRTCECPPPSTCGERCDKSGCIDACRP